MLEKTGVLVENPHAFARLVDVGFQGNEETHRITFPRKALDEALASAPSSLTLHDRDGNPSATLEGDEVHFVPASSALRILDRKTQAIREGDSKDFVDYVKIADGLKNISYLSTAFIPRDIPQDIADAWRLYMVLSYSKRPIVSGAFTHFGVPRMGELMSYFRDGQRRPRARSRWRSSPVARIRLCAGARIPSATSSTAPSGASRSRSFRCSSSA